MITRINLALVCLVLFFFIFTGCGTSMKVLSSDPDTSEDILSGSENKITRIILDDSTAEFGTHVAISPFKTEWKTASVVRREYDEINVFHAFDSWKFTEGTTMHTAVPTNQIRSITIPADRLALGIVLGGIVGAAFGAGLVYLENSAFPNVSVSGLSPGINTLFIIEAVLEAAALVFAGATLGGQMGASHQTMYTR